MGSVQPRACTSHVLRKSCGGSCQAVLCLYFSSCSLSPSGAGISEPGTDISWMDSGMRSWGVYQVTQRFSLRAGDEQKGTLRPHPAVPHTTRQGGASHPPAG